MKRKIIEIDSNKCNGCGLCIRACHEGALKLVDGKAVLISDQYCDGLGDCLGECPVGAISIQEREAAAFDEELVRSKQKNHFGGCPGMQMKTMACQAEPSDSISNDISHLAQWPCQIKLVGVNAPYFDSAHILIAADCTAYAYACIHKDFMKGRVTIIGCPKLDEGSYADKLALIFKANRIKSITVLRMEVPCCGGIVRAVEEALRACGKEIELNIHTISIDGTIK